MEEHQRQYTTHRWHAWCSSSAAAAPECGHPWPRCAQCCECAAWCPDPSLPFQGSRPAFAADLHHSQAIKHSRTMPWSDTGLHHACVKWVSSKCGLAEPAAPQYCDPLQEPQFPQVLVTLPMLSPCIWHGTPGESSAWRLWLRTTCTLSIAAIAKPRAWLLCQCRSYCTDTAGLYIGPCQLPPGKALKGSGLN